MTHLNKQPRYRTEHMTSAAIHCTQSLELTRLSESCLKHTQMHTARTTYAHAIRPATRAHVVGVQKNEPPAARARRTVV
jgi:hypothetical protein